MADKEINQTYDAAREDVWQALRATLHELKYKDIRQDRDAGTIEFRTGLSWLSWRGQQMTATVRDAGSNATELSLTGGLALKVQATSWGEKKKIAQTVLNRVELSLPQPVTTMEPVRG